LNFIEAKMEHTCDLSYYKNMWDGNHPITYNQYSAMNDGWIEKFIDKQEPLRMLEKIIKINRPSFETRPEGFNEEPDGFN